MTATGTLGILVGGGPAPGINCVICGGHDRRAQPRLPRPRHPRGLPLADARRARPRAASSTIDAVCAASTSAAARCSAPRATTRPRAARPSATVVGTAPGLGVDHLVTIGGDDTALSSSHVARAGAAGRIHVVHVPKTIDNDLPLPDGIPTFGFQTARDVGAEIVRNLVEDATTTSRWYFVVLDGPQGRAPGARHRQGRRRHAHDHPEEFSASPAIRFERHRRHRRGRDRQAAGRWAAPTASPCSPKG